MKIRPYYLLLLALFSAGTVTSGCAVFDATGEGVEAVGRGTGEAIEGTGQAISSAANQTEEDWEERRNRRQARANY